MIKSCLMLIGLWLLCVPGVFAFDHSHADWDQLLQQHVYWNAAGTASTVDYTAFKRQQGELDKYLSTLSAVSLKNYSGWQKAQQLAFLLNAYNALTIKLILSQYPDLRSIKDLGSLFSSPWKKKFFTLLGKQRNLDEIEHAMIRQPGAFDDPRIHAAVICASIGCPGIRNEAFVADRLDGQLEDSLRRFLSDHSRNRYNAETGRMEISKIFAWYGDDFVDYRGHPSVASFLGDYADLLSADKTEQLRIKAGEAPLEFLDYDWRLNDYRN